jgi:hypothetical protein
VVREGLYDRIEAIFRAFEWNVVTLKYGAKQRRAFAEPGGERLRLDRWLPEPALFGPDVPWRRRLARTAHSTKSAIRARGDGDLEAPRATPNWRR